MIKILKQTPVTFEGSDRVELLVLNTEGCKNGPCSCCCYEDYDPLDTYASCYDVHRCGRSQNTYFIIA